MKKLLVTAIGAAAAFGAFADLLNAQRFEGMTQAETSVAALNTQAGGTYWSEANGATNTYAIVAYDGTSQDPAVPQPDAFAELTDPANALSVKTTFGKPISFSVNDGATAQSIDTGIFFDSLVKFTVCEDQPSTNDYAEAKIIMWLQEQYSGDVVVGTNLMIRAGFLSVGENGVEVSNAVYTCGNNIPGDFADKWHRVTIKAIADITADGYGVPGFAIYVDGNGDSCDFIANTAEPKWDDRSFNYTLTYVASQLSNGLFPSLVQGADALNKQKLTAASFDGTGFLNDLVFTDTAPTFAADPIPTIKRAVVTIDGDDTECETFADAVNLAGLASASAVVTISPLMDFVLEEPVEFTGEADITLDFAGFVITNALADAAITNSAKTLTVTDSVGNGGIYCLDEGGAFYQTAATFEEGTVYSSLSITDGNFWGDDVAEMITLEGGEEYPGERQIISGGAFASDMNDADKLVAGKIFGEAGEDGLYPVIDEPVTKYYTIGFAYGDPLTTNSSQVAEGALPSEPSAEAVAVEGKGFAGWDDTIVAAAADKVYTAQYTNNIYTITFVIGESSTPVQKEYGSTITSVPEIPVRAGYTGSWDDDPAGDTVTGDKTYTYTYSAETYTITFVNEIGDDPASTNYTIESGEIILPTATTSMLDVKFDGWTNTTITTAITNFTPTAENLATFTLYAKWSPVGSGGWDVDPSAGEGKTAGEEYSALTGTPLAAADAPKLTTWATTYGVQMAAVAEATAGSTTYDAYLLNCEPTAEAVAAAKAAFKLNITFEGGTPTVTTPTGYNVTPTIYRSSDLKNWSTESSGTFYKAVLEL